MKDMTVGGPPPGRSVLVVGAGAVGSFLAGVLAVGGHPVVLVDRRSAPGRGPLWVVDAGGRRLEAIVERMTAVEDAAREPGLIVFAVKVFDLERALEACRAWPDAPTLTIQNGVGAEELVQERRPGAPLVAGSLTTPLEPIEGGVAWRRRGGLALAPVAGPVEPLIDEILAAAAAVGLPARRLDDARAMKWSKLLGNLVANATSALVDMDAGDVYSDPGLFRVERRQLLETAAVMDALGVRAVALPSANTPLLVRAMRFVEPVSRVVLARVVRGARGGKSPSLRLHLQSGRSGPSEIGWMNGAVVRWGRRLGVPTPVNQRLTELYEAALTDPELRAELAGHPERLVAAVEAASLSEPSDDAGDAGDDAGAAGRDTSGG
jgi:2-dehydropantoate 2-reductase